MSTVFAKIFAFIPDFFFWTLFDKNHPCFSPSLASQRAKSRPAGTGSSGLRGIYGAGVLDRCMEEGVQFDCCIGVSAGSANMCSYVAGQHGRNKPFYQDYSFRKEYMSVGNAEA